MSRQVKREGEKEGFLGRVLLKLSGIGVSFLEICLRESTCLKLSIFLMAITSLRCGIFVWAHMQSLFTFTGEGLLRSSRLLKLSRQRLWVVLSRSSVSVTCLRARAF